MTELSYYTPNSLILPPSRFFDERLKNVNEEIRNILGRVDTHVSRESLAVSTLPLTLKPKGGVCSSTGKCGHHPPSPIPARTTDGGPSSISSCGIPLASQQLSSGYCETASVSLTDESAKSVSRSPQDGEGQEVLGRVEVSKWMEQHLPSYIFPILSTMLKPTASTSSLLHSPLLSSSSSSSYVQKELSALHCHLLEVEESYHGVKHDLDDAKFKWVDQHRELQSTAVRLKRELEEAVSGVYRDVEEKMCVMRMTLNEVQHQKCFEMQTKMQEVCEGIQKGWTSSLHQCQAETRAKMANIEEEVKTWRGELMTSLHQKLEPFKGFVSDFQQQLERVQTELVRAIRTINEQNIAIQLLRDERIVHRSEMRECKRDFQRLELVLRHFFSLYSACSSSPKEFSLSSTDNSRHSSAEFVTENDSSNSDVSLLLCNAEEEHNGESDGNGSPFQQYSSSHLEEKKIQKKLSTSDSEERKERKHRLRPRGGQPARWKDRLKSLQKQVSAMKKKSCCHCHMPCSLACSSVDTALFYARHQPNFANFSSSLPLASTTLPSSSPGNVRTMDAPVAMARKNVESTRHSLCVAHPLGHQPLSESEERLRQWNTENIPKNQKDDRLISCNPRASEPNERKDDNIDVIELSALDARSFMASANVIAYPPPLTSDSESDRDNHHLSRLALD